jgi:hypothetical protein
MDAPPDWLVIVGLYAVGFILFALWPGRKKGR